MRVFPLMSAINPSDEDFVATVLLIEGDPVEEGGVMSSEEADITGEVETGAVDVVVVPMCCRFACLFPLVSSEAFNTFLELVLTDENRK